jgi:uncharacterized protein (TIGR00730 family)
LSGRAVRTVCVYTGSYSGTHAGYAEAARGLVAELASRELELVYGGGRLGLMGVLADAALELGVKITGVIPEALTHREVARLDLADLHVVATMSERQRLMAEFGDGFVALPGGYGTLAEVTDVLALTQLGLLRKAVGLLDVGGYWRPFEQQLDVSVREGFVTQAGRAQVLLDTEPGPLLDHLVAWQPPAADPRVAVPSADATVGA